MQVHSANLTLKAAKMGVRSYNEELGFLEKMTSVSWRIKKGFVPNMKVEGIFYVNNLLEKLMFEELRNSCRPGNVGGFLPGVKQIGNVAALPGIVGHSIGLPDIHSGYGFAIGNMAAFDMDDPKAIVSPEETCDGCLLGGFILCDESVLQLPDTCHVMFITATALNFVSEQP
ncbi:hypothetical protein HPB49_019065 [Dermacentor silvarum]|uniref:Uncharacterized protein n=1 Tax=Dermacentor silvarum TaxID=543639 RepID=A0ACB8DQ20_DERSI|nr:hypothetical protein HPB49_019065 [Dermacentor silvarum]